MAIGVAYDADLEAARRVLLEACEASEGVRTSPPVEVWVEEFGESSINFAVGYWHAADIASRWRVRDAVAIGVKSGLDRAGIAIPFPQRTLWIGPGSTELGIRTQDQSASRSAETTGLQRWSSVVAHRCQHRCITRSRPRILHGVTPPRERGSRPPSETFHV